MSFTMDNTEGFVQETLDEMNNELELAMEGIDIDSSEYNHELQHYSEMIFNKYC